MIELKQVDFYGFKNALELSNGIVKLIVTTDVGPRILFYGYTGGQNFFKVFENESAPIRDGEWHNYGGHRLWYAPEAAHRTYYPDNDPVDWDFSDGKLTMFCPDETSRWIGKKIVIVMSENSTAVTIDHTFKNIGMWPIEASIWSMSVMAPGGVLKVPQSKFVNHGSGPDETFAPSRSIVIWPYTPMNDPRLVWGDKFFEMHQNDAYPGKLKVGMLNEFGWAEYELNGETFHKKHSFEKDAVYPDMNCNCEFFTMPGFLEFETLSPMIKFNENEEATHTEVWSLTR